MDIETLARLEVAKGSPVAFHEGVWWYRIKPFYSSPLHSLVAFSPGQARPPFLYRLIGYEHLVPKEEEANAKLGLMMLADINQYDIDGLSANTRSHVRRGLKRTEVRRLHDVRDLVEQGVEINRSALSRQRWGTDSRWYVQEKLWRREIEGAHALGLREHWGAHFSGKLVAWLRAYELDGTVCITSAMSHTDFLGHYPNDALLHTFLSDCRSRPGIKSVIFGLDCAKQSLNEFKMRFGFRVVCVPIYRWLSPGVRSLAKFTRYHHYLKEEASAVGDGVPEASNQSDE